MTMLKFNNVSKQYPYTKHFLFEDVTFEVSKGERVGIVAEKQCGKSSIVKMLAELTTPTSGEILLDGKDIYGILPQQRGIGIVFDDFALIKGKTVLKNVIFPLKVRKTANGEQVAKQSIEKFGLQNEIKTKAKNLDDDQKLRTALARLDTRQDLQIVVFDDVCRNIDLQKAIEYIDVFLNNRDVAILQTATDIDHLYKCDRIYVLADGKIAFFGTFEQAKEYINTSNCFDKFGINEEIEKIVGGKQV